MASGSWQVDAGEIERPHLFALYDLVSALEMESCFVTERFDAVDVGGVERIKADVIFFVIDDFVEFPLHRHLLTVANVTFKYTILGTDAITFHDVDDFGTAFVIADVVADNPIH